MTPELHPIARHREPTALSIRLARTLTLCCAFLFGAPLAADARPAQLRDLDAELRGEVVERIAELLAEQHLFPEIGMQCADHVLGRLEDGAYDELTDPHEFASVLTRDLHSIKRDAHLRIEAGAEDPWREEEGADPEQARRKMHEDFRRRNFGFQRVEFLDGMIGYLSLTCFAPTEVAGDVAAAAMRLLAETDAVIIDVRDNGGGSGDMVQLLASYFFEEPTHLCSYEDRGEDLIRQSWTLPHLPGPRMAKTPLYILTSGRTGSAAEEFTYDLKHLGRATIIGETTGGGGHTCTSTRVAGMFNVVIPSGRPIHPVTGTDWEAVGVKPHLGLPADRALGRARLEALRALEERAAGDEPRLSRIRWALEGVRGEVEPFALSEDSRAEYVGRYGRLSVTVEGDVLYGSHSPGQRALLTPVAEDRFLVEGVPHIRLRFDRDEEGRVKAAVTEYDDGRELAIERDR